MGVSSRVTLIPLSSLFVIYRLRGSCSHQSFISSIRHPILVKTSSSTISIRNKIVEMCYGAQWANILKDRPTSTMGPIYGPTAERSVILQRENDCSTLRASVRNGRGQAEHYCRCKRDAISKSKTLKRRDCAGGLLATLLEYRRDI